jgi:chromosome segregation ATPase
MKSRGLTIIAGALCVLLASAASGQDDKRATREREALRRAQQALRGAQEQQTTLQREKAALAAEQEKLVEAAKRNGAQLGAAQAQAGRSRAELTRVRAELETLRGELETLRSTSTAQQQALQARGDEQAQQLQQAQRLLAERAQALSAVAQLLERSTTSLADAEAKNRQLHAIGLKVIDDYRGKGGDGSPGVRDPFFGLKQVQLEDRAEALRTELDALRVAHGLPAAAAPR